MQLNQNSDYDSETDQEVLAQVIAESRVTAMKSQAGCNAGNSSSEG